MTVLVDWAIATPLAANIKKGARILGKVISGFGK